MDCISSNRELTERYSIVEDNKNIPLFSKPEITKKLPAVVPTKIKKLITNGGIQVLSGTGSFPWLAVKVATKTNT
jgi:hypothetical protein